MSERWTVRRGFLPSSGWLAFRWHADGIDLEHFPTWRAAFDYADRMARAVA